MVLAAQLHAGVDGYADALHRGQLKYKGHIGCEHEGHFLYDKSRGFRVAHIGPQVISAVNDTEVIGELGNNQFEINFRPITLAGAPFLTWERFVQEKLAKLHQAASAHSAFPLLVAFPPVLSAQDLAREQLAPGVRVASVEREWLARRAQLLEGGHKIEFDGFSPESIAFAASRCALQLHLELPVDEAEAGLLWNLVMLVTPVALAVSTGSPRFLNGLEPDLELRIRMWDYLDDLGRGRIFYGPGFIKSAIDVLRHYASLPFIHLGETATDDNRLWLRRQVKNTWAHVRLVPELEHWRIEVRVFPAVRPLDASITAAFFYGLIRGLRKADRYTNFTERIDFSSVRANLYTAGVLGLDAELAWLDNQRYGVVPLVLSELLPLARQGLYDSGVDPGEIERCLGGLEYRVRNHATPAHWIRAVMRTSGSHSEEAQIELARKLREVHDSSEYLKLP